MMVTDLWMEGVVQCKAKSVTMSNNDDKVKNVVPGCKVKCLPVHLAPLARGLVLQPVSKNTVRNAWQRHRKPYQLQSAQKCAIRYHSGHRFFSLQTRFKNV